MTTMRSEQIRLSLADGRGRRLFTGVLLLSFALSYTACDFGGVDTSAAPKVRILRPGDQAPVGNELLIRISAVPAGDDDNYISFVNVNLNSKLLGEAKLQGDHYVYRWNSASVSDGEYRLEAIAFDRNQARGLSNPVRITVQNTTTGEGPATIIESPRDAEQVEGMVRVIAQRLPGEPDIVRMDLLVDGVLLQSIEAPPYAFDWDVSKETTGSHLLQIRAFSAPTVFRYSDAVTVTTTETDTSGTGGSTTRPKADYRATGIVGEVKGSVAVGFNNDLYVGTLTGTLYCFAPSGHLRWQYATDGPIRSTPVVGNNEDVFVTSEDGRLYGLNSNGARLWPPYNTASVLRSTPTLGVEGYLYVGDSDGRVHAVNTFNGLSLPEWPRKVANAPIVVPPVITRNRLVIVAATDGFVYALRPDGTVAWRSLTNVGSVSVGMAVVEVTRTVPLPGGGTATDTGNVLYVVSNSGRLFALNAADGSVDWDHPLAGPLRSGPVVGPDGVVYVGTSTGLVAFEEEEDEHKPRLRFIYPAVDVGTPVVDANENVFFVSGKALVAITPVNTPLWTQSFDLRAEADGPLTIGRDGRVYVATNSGVLYGVQTGSVGLAQEKWPMFQRNARHTGRLGLDATDG